MSELSATVIDDVPLVRSSVPLAGALQVFSTQLVSVTIAGLGIGSGVPKLHPVVVQSGAVLLTGGGIEVGPIVQLAPVQLSANRLVEPSGVGASGTTVPPPPMFRPPQVRFLMRTLLPSSVLPQTPPGVPVVNSRNAPLTDAVVEVVVDVVVLVVELVLLVVEVLVVVEVVLVVGTVVLVLVEVVVVVGVQLGSPGCIVQVQVPAVHWSRIDALQALRAAPDKPAHPAAISSAHCFEPQSGGAAFAPETKTPAASATANNVTTAQKALLERLSEMPLAELKRHVNGRQWMAAAFAASGSTEPE